MLLDTIFAPFVKVATLSLEEACPMSTLVYRISVLLSVILADVPGGTNLGLFWLLWALISGRFLLSRGAVFPALADGGYVRDARVFPEKHLCL